jgi:glycosyltransferase involved in cell wall biosynthesis
MDSLSNAHDHAHTLVEDLSEIAAHDESPTVPAAAAAAAAALLVRRQVPVPHVSVVIPTLNEAENLKWLLPRLPDWLDEILIVDGCSTDATIAVAKELRPEVKIVLETRRGKGAALRAGFEAATGDIIVMMDADGSMHPDEIIRYVAALMTGADFAKGSRFMQGAGTSDMTLFRRTGNLGLTLAVRSLYGSSFSDLCYGYMAFWRRHVPLLRSDCDGFEIETLINIRALKGKLKIVEVASYESDRIHGTSNLRAIPDGWRVLKTILRERVGRGQPLRAAEAA